MELNGPKRPQMGLNRVKRLNEAKQAKWGNTVLKGAKQAEGVQTMPNRVILG